MHCKVCGNADVWLALSRPRVPIMQNVVCPTRAAALAAPSGTLSLVECKRCGFAFNQDFDEERVRYDVDYDNDVPSPTFASYYKSLAHSLIDRLKLDDCVVYDVGCGKGTFLDELCSQAPTVRGVGIDPSCTPSVRGRVELRRATFGSDQFAPSARLVLLRHVLEHIGQPVPFLRELRKATPAGAHVFVEVPDVTWTFRAGAFWDFCYEHCNYFTPASLRTALSLAGFRVLEQQTSFGDQYQWALCSPTEAEAPQLRSPSSLAQDYAKSERAMLDRFRVLAADTAYVVWGMAAKGVTFTTLVDGIVAGIDINQKKQGKFAPVSGVEIQPPERVSSDTGVFVMNPNYEKEIRSKLAELRVAPVVVVV
jgi:hypothetical protein